MMLKNALHRRSTIAFLGACALLIALKLLFDHYPGDYTAKGQAQAFTWPLVGAIMLIGALGLGAERATGLPDAFADLARERRGVLLAAAAGLAYGVLTILLPGSNPVAIGDWPHVAWPWSVPFYTFGAIFLEFLLRLGALCIFVWIVHVMILRRRWLIPVFWTVNCLVALYEILPATIAQATSGQWGAVALTPIQPLYWSNVLEGWLLFRFGWFAPIVFRLAFYLVWHIIYGGLGPFSA